MRSQYHSGVVLDFSAHPSSLSSSSPPLQYFSHPVCPIRNKILRVAACFWVLLRFATAEKPDDAASRRANRRRQISLKKTRRSGRGKREIERESGRMKVSLWWLRCCRAGPAVSSSCRQWCSSCYGCYSNGALSHSSRTFQTKAYRGPRPNSNRIENFPFATTATRTPTSYYLRKDATPGQRGPRYRFYSSRSSASPSMADIKWTGHQVRKTFFDYFKERGHTIGMPRFFLLLLNSLAHSHSHSFSTWDFYSARALNMPFSSLSVCLDLFYCKS